MVRGSRRKGVSVSFFMKLTYLCLHSQLLGVSANVGGMLFEALLRATEYVDCECVDMFREGSSFVLRARRMCVFVVLCTKLVGLLDHAGLGEHVPCSSRISEDELWEKRSQHNKSLLNRMRDDVHSQWLFEHTCKESQRGWNSKPEPVTDSMIDDVLMSPRFAIAQSRPDGSSKFRAIDNLSYSREGKVESINGHTHISDKLRHHTLDKYCVALKCFVQRFARLPHMFKADVDAAI